MTESSTFVSRCFALITCRRTIFESNEDNEKFEFIEGHSEAEENDQRLLTTRTSYLDLQNHDIDLGRGLTDDGYRDVNEMYDGKIISLPELKKSGYQHEVDSVSTGLNIDKNDEVKQGETSDETI